jgi:hypothetical protein
MNKPVGWLVNGRIFDNKIKALEEAKWKSDEVKFYFNDDILTKHDFTKEPSKDFEQLCLESILKLRDTYQHICLWFTGGSDSGTILSLFEKYNIRLDEILFYDRQYQVYEAWDQESLHIKKEMDRFKKAQPHCKLTVIHIGYENAQKFYKRNKDEWFYAPYTNIRFSKNLRYNIIDNTPQLGSNFEKKNRIDIFARDKPKLIMHEKKWYLTFFDNIEYDTYKIGFHHFYWDNLDIMTKQAHMVIRWFESKENFTENFLHKVQSHPPGPLYSEYCKALGLKLPNWIYLSEGWNKSTTNRFDKNYESHNIEKYANKHDKKIFNYYNNGLNYINKFFNISDGGECVGNNLSKTYLIKNLTLTRDY